MGHFARSSFSNYHVFNTLHLHISTKLHFPLYPILPHVWHLSKREFFKNLWNYQNLSLGKLMPHCIPHFYPLYDITDASHKIPRKKFV